MVNRLKSQAKTFKDICLLASYSLAGGIPLLSYQDKMATATGFDTGGHEDDLGVLSAINLHGFTTMDSQKGALWEKEKNGIVTLAENGYPASMQHQYLSGLLDKKLKIRLEHFLRLQCRLLSYKEYHYMKLSLDDLKSRIKDLHILDDKTIAKLSKQKPEYMVATYMLIKENAYVLIENEMHREQKEALEQKLREWNMIISTEYGGGIDFTHEKITWDKLKFICKMTEYPELLQEKMSEIPSNVEIMETDEGIGKFHIKGTRKDITFPLIDPPRDLKMLESGYCIIEPGTKSIFNVTFDVGKPLSFLSYGAQSAFEELNPQFPNVDIEEEAVQISIIDCVPGRSTLLSKLERFFNQNLSSTLS